MDYFNFSRWLKRAKIDRNRAYYCIRVVEGKPPKREKPNPENDPYSTHYRTFVFPRSIADRITWLAKIKGVPRLELVKNIFLDYLGKHEHEIKKAKAAAEDEIKKAKAAASGKTKSKSKSAAAGK